MQIKRYKFQRERVEAVERLTVGDSGYKPECEPGAEYVLASDYDELDMDLMEARGLCDSLTEMLKEAYKERDALKADGVRLIGKTLLDGVKEQRNYWQKRALSAEKAAAMRTGEGE